MVLVFRVKLKQNSAFYDTLEYGNNEVGKHAATVDKLIELATDMYCVLNLIRDYPTH